MSTVNKNGYLVTHRTIDGYLPAYFQSRSYACTDWDGLNSLIVHLTDRHVDTYPKNDLGLPDIPNVLIAYPLHIYSRDPATDTGDEDTTTLAVGRPADDRGSDGFA